MQYLNDLSIVKCLLLFVIIIIAIPIISIVKILTTSYLLAIGAYLGFMFWVLRYVGRFALYPGSTQFITSDMEDKLSIEILKASLHIFENLEYVLQRIIKRQLFITEVQIGMVLQKNFNAMKEIFGMFEQTLSKRKLNLLMLYKQLHRELMFQMDPDHSQDIKTQTISFVAVANRPRTLQKLTQQQHQFLVMRCDNIHNISQEILQILAYFKGPQKSLLTYSGIKHYCTKERLYQIRFGFYNWKTIYDFDLNLVKMQDGSLIQTVVIYREKSYEEIMESPDKNALRRSQDDPKPAILFCNPNGVFIQFFGLDNSYVRSYLRRGFKVILWNYRGYGQSQSTPTLAQSQRDAIELYDHYSLQHTIPVIHGYSIGGIAAVAVAKKFPNQVKFLIADRTFSSIQSMSRSLGCVINTLTKIVFYSDNFSLAQQFKQCHNSYKLLICDEHDEVIGEGSSLKRALLDTFTREENCKLYDVVQNSSLLGVGSENKPKNGVQSLSNNLDKYQDQQKQLRAEDVKPYPRCQEDAVCGTQAQFTAQGLYKSVSLHYGLAQKLTISLQRLFKFSLKLNQQSRSVRGNEANQNDTMTMQHNLPKQQSLSVNSVRTNPNKQPSKDQKAEELIRILEDIDGGGVNLFNKNNLIYLFNNKPRSDLKDTCRSYLLGLSYYGSCRPVRSHQFAYNSKSIKKKTIGKLEATINKLQNLSNRRGTQTVTKHNQTERLEAESVSHWQFEEGEINALRNLIEVFKQAQKILFKTAQSQAFDRKVGMLLPTSNGHNCDLNNVELEILLSLVSKVHPSQQKQGQSSQMREEEF